MNKYIATIFILMAISCSPVQQTPVSVKGKWYVAGKLNESYISINFSDSTALFNVLADTVFRFKYSIDQPTRTIWLTDVLNQKKSARILKATSDSLVFDRLWDLNTVQRFFNKKL